MSEIQTQGFSVKKNRYWVLHVHVYPIWHALASTFFAFATKAAGKLSHCANISPICCLYTCATKGKPATG